MLVFGVFWKYLANSDPYSIAKNFNQIFCLFKAWDANKPIQLESSPEGQSYQMLVFCVFWKYLANSDLYSIAKIFNQIFSLFQAWDANKPKQMESSREGQSYQMF